MHKLKFKPMVTRIKLNPEQAVLACNCFESGRIETYHGINRDVLPPELLYRRYRLDPAGPVCGGRGIRVYLYDQRWGYRGDTADPQIGMS